ncbi:MAG: mechanosensitive ion channel [Thermoanaerobaculia bacterium]|nr:mechanosensitive ion channel [Thermoanaerobaculia bacterium]
MPSWAALIPAIAVVVSVVVLLGAMRRRWRLLRLLTLPALLGSLLIGVWIFERLAADGPGWVENLQYWLLIAFLAVSVIRVAGLYLFEIYLRESRGLHLPPLLVKVSVTTAYLLAAFVIFRVAFPDRNITPLLATSAVTSLVLGLALQPILGNFFSGLVLTVEQPFRINDWIRVGDTEGRVVEINWRTTYVRTRDNDTKVYPNGVIAGAELLNLSSPHPLHMERIHVGVHYRTPPYRVERAVLDAAARVDLVLDAPAPTCYLLEFGESSILYEVRVWTENIARLPFLNDQVKREIWEEFRRRGITIPFPIRTLEIEPRVRTVEVVQRDEVPERRRVATLWVAEGEQRGRSIRLQESAIVGRGEDCDLVLSAPDVSKEHFRVVHDEKEGWVLEDLESRLGTSINGVEVTRGPLHPLDRIQVASTTIVFEEHGE